MLAKRCGDLTALRLLVSLLFSSRRVTLSRSAQQRQLTGAGASFPYPIYSKWFDEYYKRPACKSTISPSAAAAAYARLLARTVDFGATRRSDDRRGAGPSGAAHRPHSDRHRRRLRRIQHSRHSESGLKLTPDVLADIFLGEITHWNDPRIQELNPELHLPNLAIAVARRADASGTTFTFSDYLSTVSEKWAQRRRPRPLAQLADRPRCPGQ